MSVFRCFGTGDPQYEHYHDREWGFPIVEERPLYELLCLELFQSGLSWLTILHKREAFRAAFRNFEPDVVSRFRAADVKRLLADASIVRNRAKIDACIANATAVQGLHRSGQTLAEWFWSASDGSGQGAGALRELPSTTSASVALAKRLKSAGFRFVGPTTVYSTMQSCGVVNDHLAACPVRPKAERQRQRVLRQRRSDAADRG